MNTDDPGLSFVQVPAISAIFHHAAPFFGLVLSTTNPYRFLELLPLMECSTLSLHYHQKNCIKALMKAGFMKVFSMLTNSDGYHLFPKVSSACYLRTGVFLRQRTFP